jgi:hypothetical protein
VYSHAARNERVERGQVLTAQTSVPVEYRTRAILRAPFGSFIDWPGDSFPAAEAPFLVCIVGDFRFGTSLAEVTRNASPRGRRVQVRWIHKDQDLRGCHILFASRSESKRYAKDLASGTGSGCSNCRREAGLFDRVSGPAVRGDHVEANEAYLRLSSRLLARAPSCR